MRVASATADPPGAAAGACQIERIACGAKHRIGGARARTKLGRVGFCEHDCACAANGGDRRFIGNRDVVAINQRPVRGANARGVGEILDAHRQTMKRRQRLARHHLPLGLASFLAGTLIGGGDHRIDCRIDGLDPGDAALQQLNRRERLAADETARLGGREFAGQCHGACPL